MAQHKWHKEIKAWADGAEIQERLMIEDIKEIKWRKTLTNPLWDCDDIEFRIKPQPKEPNIEGNCYGDGNVYRGTRSSDSTIKTYTYPQDWLNKNPITQPKEPQYLYVYLDDNYEFSPIPLTGEWEYIGKIKLEESDE